jgi:cell division protein ZapA
LSGNVRRGRLQPGTEKVLNLGTQVYIVTPASAARQWLIGAGAKFRQEGGMSAQPVDIQIFGRSLRVNCPPEQQDALNMAAEDLNQRLQDLKVRTRVTNTEQLVFIAALNVCHELAQERLKTRDYAANMEQRIRMLQQTIEQALLEQGRISERQDAQFE